jgi:hypothetical protein
MQPMDYIGLDVHKQKISYCVKDDSGKIDAEGWILATRFDLDRWMKMLPQPLPAARPLTGGTCRAPDEHSIDWADHRADVGIGNR